ncbi:site-specific integrase [Hydrogenivirga sp. 128-5-R1-1]|uniref:tyrosine-type recombinase/integrase n=1 Tax=Hydrogenivirga sp. 128-5-R1-1 TaxID=392423 RepID=UPI00015F32D3|nr:site-specific integrase [Hydrogenivirga sp. 128-5-R1-1]EDP74833.1 integrase protein [Hydrogenivirga sp. 128-5-R1-1]
MDWLIDTYLDELRKIRDPKTVETKEHLLKHLTAYADDLIDLDRGELIRFYESLQKKGLKESTIREILKTVRQFYHWLRQRGYSIEFDSEALKDIYRAKRRQEKKKKKYYSDEELELILSAIRGTLEGFDPKHPIYYLLVIFLVSSGLRLSEALSVKSKDVKVKKVLTSEGGEKEIWTVHVREGKFGKEREALVHFFRPEWKTLWEKWLERLKPDDFVFTYTIRYPKSTKTLVLKTDTAKRFFWELEKELKEKGYEIEVNAHRFRNTYITKLATLGFPVNLIAEWVGHSKISTTMDIYMEAEKEKMLETIIGKF